MIRSFRHRGLKRLYEQGDVSGIRSGLRKRVENILTALDVAESPQAMRIPRFRLHPLTGDRAGYWAVTVRANWRIVFRIHDCNAWDVELIDYH